MDHHGIPHPVCLISGTGFATVLSTGHPQIGWFTWFTASKSVTYRGASHQLFPRRFFPRCCLRDRSNVQSVAPKCFLPQVPHKVRSWLVVGPKLVVMGWISSYMLLSPQLSNRSWELPNFTGKWPSNPQKWQGLRGREAMRSQFPWEGYSFPGSANGALGYDPISFIYFRSLCNRHSCNVGYRLIPIMMPISVYY